MKSNIPSTSSVIHRGAFCLSIGLALVAGPVVIAADPVADFRENYEGLEVGSPDPHFADFKSNHPTGQIEVAAEAPGAEHFYPGNTRYLSVQSLSGINPDDQGSGTQFHGGAAGFVPFQGGIPEVVTAGFDFIVGETHAELLFGVGGAPTSRSDDQHLSALLRIRGTLGLSNRTEITAITPDGSENADFQPGVPYRIEMVINNSGSDIVYESPLGERVLGDQKFDLYLFNHRTRSLQLIFRGVDFSHRERALEGFAFATFRYDATGRALDIKINDVAVFENRIVLTGAEFVPPGALTALVEFEELEATEETRSPLWDLPGRVVADTEGVFGENNRKFFHVNRRTLPGDSTSSKFRFNDVVPLLSYGMDFVLHRDDVVTSFSDGHDAVSLNITGGDTVANVQLTVRIRIDGTRSVGNDGDPSEATPRIIVVQDEAAQAWAWGLDWETPYRMEVVLNQTGDTVTYYTPWDDEPVTLPNERLHLYLYNLETNENLSFARGHDTPYALEGLFNIGISNPFDRAGNMADFFFKHVTGRPIDLSMDNIMFFENAAVVTKPGAIAAAPPRIVSTETRPANINAYQPHLLDRLVVTLEGEEGIGYGIERSDDLLQFNDMRAVVPVESGGEPRATVELPFRKDEGSFFRFYPRQR